MPQILYDRIVQRKDIQNLLFAFSYKVRAILGDYLTKVILYGSYARGEQTKESDIDIMLLTTLSDKEIEKLEPSVFDIAFELEMEYFIHISVVIKNEAHFNYWLGALPFYDNVKREGIVLYG